MTEAMFAILFTFGLIVGVWLFCAFCWFLRRRYKEWNR